MDGQILVINNAKDASLCLAHSLLKGGYNCTFVNSEGEADRLLERWGFKAFAAIVYSGEYSVIISPPKLGFAS